MRAADANGATILPLRTEVYDGSGAVVERSEVTSVEYNLAIPDAVFVYTAPAGATVFNFNGGTGAEVKRQLCEELLAPACRPAPRKKP